MLSRECRRITTHQSHLVPTWYPEVLLLVFMVLEGDATNPTLADLLSHLKPPCILTALIQTTLPGIFFCWIVATCAALTPLLTSPH